MNFGHDEIGEFSIIRSIEETKDVRLAKQG